jgi:hypothetical protein
VTGDVKADDYPRFSVGRTGEVTPELGIGSRFGEWMVKWDLVAEEEDIAFVGGRMPFLASDNEC